MAVAFHCPDCGHHGYAITFVGPPAVVPPRCLSCQAIAGIPFPAEREAMRAFLFRTPPPSTDVAA
jgi:hypothetical protein